MTETEALEAFWAELSIALDLDCDTVEALVQERIAQMSDEEVAALDAAVNSTAAFFRELFGV